MSDPRIRDSINKAKEFTQLWVKFHEIYKVAMGKSSISPEEEKAFFDTKAIIARKFQTLADSMTIDRHTIDRTYDVLSQILSLQSISTLAEHTLKKIENDWHQSYISLNRLLGHLEGQETIEADQKRNPAKGTSNKPGVIISVVVMIIFALVILFIIHMFGVDILGVISRTLNLR